MKRKAAEDMTNVRVPKLKGLNDCLVTKYTWISIIFLLQVNIIRYAKGRVAFTNSSGLNSLSKTNIAA